MRRGFFSKLLTTAMISTMCLATSATAFAASGSWVQDSTGWWYSYSGGGYPKSQWVEIDSSYYYFDSTGYMAAGEYRDGYWTESSGARSKTYTGGAWKTNQTGKWYEDKTGYYPTNCWLKIDGSYYYFNGSGYAEVNKWVDGYYLDKDGKWIADAVFTDYSGVYVDSFAGRASVTVKNVYDTYYSFTIKWPTSAYVSSEWTFTGMMDYTGIINYTDCTKTTINYDANGGSTTKTAYTNGTGTIKISGNNLTWDDKKENTATGNTFIKQEKTTTTEVDYSGTYIEPTLHRAAVTVETSINDFYEITVDYPDDNGNIDKYTFTGSFDADGKLTYTDCVKTHEDFKTDGSSSSYRVYKNGSGTLTYSDKTITWENNNEDIEYTTYELSE